MNGKFIVFDGPDGSGTTRQSTFLADALREKGLPVVLTAEPTESTIGKQIRTMIEGESLPSADAIQLLFCADRADHVKNTIAPSLEDGKIVICDRYSLSTMIYGEAQGVDRSWLEQVNAGFPGPDVTFITLPPFEVCMERLNRRPQRDQFELESFQRRVFELYKSLEDPSILFVDTSGSKQQSASFVYEKVEQMLHVTEMLQM